MNSIDKVHLYGESEKQEELLTVREKEEERLLLWGLVLSCAHCGSKIRRGKF